MVKFLAHHPRQRRQDLSPSESPSPPTSPYLSPHHYNSNLNNKIDYSIPTTSELSLSHFAFPTTDLYYIDDSRQSTPSESLGYGFADKQYMQNSPSHYPQVRVQQSTPIPNSAPSVDTPPSMIDENDFAQPSWSTYQDSSYLAAHAPQQYNSSSYRQHKRLSSGSSVASGGPDSPYTVSPTYPHIVDPDNQSINSAQYESFDGVFTLFPKPSFVPANPPNGDQSFYPAFQGFNLQANDAVSMMSAPTTKPMPKQHRSSNGGGQTTSRRSFGGEMDHTPETRNTPNLDRTISAIYEDELYNPAMAATSSSQARPSGSSQGNPYNNKKFSDILQVANINRSASPNSVARQNSPFRNGSNGSEYAVAAGGFSHSNPSSPATRLGSAAQMREQQKSEHNSPSHRHDLLQPPATISPKDVDLDFAEPDADSKFTLFPPTKRQPQNTSSNTYDRRFGRGNTDGNSNTEQHFGSMASTRRQSSSNYTESSTPQQTSSSFAFLPPSVPPQVPQQYPFIANSRRQSSSMRSTSDVTPDFQFPASLSSMESTKSESGQAENIRLLPEVSQLSQPSSQESAVQRPSDTSANSGTYTCVAPSCNLRFDTSAKLQKHRRECHRTSPYSTSSPTTPSSTTTIHNTQAAQNNVSRNNAPGPHRCEKLNPSTNKPCNTVFSRSYDLTRHEDTIHNNRKQKVRCHLCTEEKTFSRNDALTRHMRVVHPDVDFPGKQRRGRNSDGADVVKQGLEGRRGGR